MKEFVIHKSNIVFNGYKEWGQIALFKVCRADCCINVSQGFYPGIASLAELSYLSLA
jgi:hypothetical protein